MKHDTPLLLMYFPELIKKLYIQHASVISDDKTLAPLRYSWILLVNSFKRINK